MLLLAVDADVHSEIVRGLRRRLPEIDIVDSRLILPEGAPDEEVLAWAASEDRVLITNDPEHDGAIRGRPCRSR